MTGVAGNIFLAAAIAFAGSAAAQAETHVIKMARIAFAPAAITIRVGDRLEWQNSDIVAHTATSKEGGFDVNVMPGQKGGTILRVAGKFDYLCRYHPNMKGQVTVEP